MKHGDKEIDRERQELQEEIEYLLQKRFHTKLVYQRAEGMKDDIDFIVFHGIVCGSCFREVVIMTRTAQIPFVVKRCEPEHKTATSVHLVEMYSDGTISSEFVLLGRPHKTIHHGDLTKIIERLSRR